jgi:hypothetical protein
MWKKEHLGVMHSAWDASVTYDTKSGPTVMVRTASDEAVSAATSDAGVSACQVAGTVDAATSADVESATLEVKVDSPGEDAERVQTDESTADSAPWLVSRAEVGGEVEEEFGLEAEGAEVAEAGSAVDTPPKVDAGSSEEVLIEPGRIEKAVGSSWASVELATPTEPELIVDMKADEEVARGTAVVAGEAKASIVDIVAVVVEVSRLVDVELLWASALPFASSTVSSSSAMQNLWLGSSTKTRHFCVTLPSDLESV